MLFSDRPRTDSTPKRNRENDYVFLNRSARVEIERVRQFLNDLARIYPAHEVPELCARIRSGNDAHFKSATFELILHAALVKLGYSLQPHPQLTNGSSSRPDFYVITPDGRDFYLEAVLASENNGADPAAQARIGTTIDALAQSSHRNFMVAIEDEGAPTSQPSGSRLRSAALTWLDSLNPDDVQAAIDSSGLDAAPTFAWNHEDWHVTLRAIPLRQERRGKVTTLVGILNSGASFVDAWTPIRNAVKFKGSKYGDLDKPLLVAVNYDSFQLDRIDEMQALYGQEQFVFTVNEPSIEPRFERAPNGAWHGKTGPQSTRVSGVWIFNALSPYTVATRRHTVYLNPWASRVLPDVLTQLPHAVANDNKIQWIDGLSLGQIFELPDGWPE